MVGVAEIDRRRRVEAEAADAHRGQRYELAELWRELVAGEANIADAFCTRERCYLVLGPSSPAPMAGRDRVLLERNLLGDSEKVLAFDYGVSVSTVASRLALALRKLGLDARASRAPVILAIAVHAYRGTGFTSGRRCDFEAHGERFRVVSAARPDNGGLAALTRAELHVVRLLVEGNSPSEIALLRRTSVRTIANQMAAVFHKTGVSGRRSLLSHLVRCAEPASAS